MPLTITGDRFDQYISGIEERIVSPELMDELGQSLASHLVSGFRSAGLQSQSGASIDALSYVGEPQKTGNGMSIGVANAEALGNPSDPAPRGTLREFFNDMNIKPSNWAGIPPTYKEVLEQKRRSGMYGGRGGGYANYLWVQESGNSAANIGPHPFIDRALTEWRQDASRIIEEHLAQTSRH